MRVFNKNISFSSHLIEQGEDILFGIHNFNGEMECCGEEVNVTDIGLGFIRFGICIQNV